MNTGTVKWFNAKKGYGFIKPEGSDNDMFVHISALQEAGIAELNEGDTVSYETTERNGKALAVSLKMIKKS